MGLGIYSLREMAMERSVIAQSFGVEISATVVARSDPQEGRTRVVGSRLRQGNESFLANVEEIKIGGKEFKVHLPIRIIAPKSDITFGDQIKVRGRLSQSKEKRVAALLLAKEIEGEDKSHLWLTARANTLREEFAHFARGRSNIGATLIPGIVVGDTRLQSQELLDSMRRSGLTHVTAVSGANFAIVIGFVLWLSGWLFKKKKVRLLVATCFIAFFIVLVRPTPSVLRAAVMALVIIVSHVTGSKAIASTSLAAAIAIVLIGDPFQAFDPGFVLSVLATSGLIFVAPLLQARFEKYLLPIAAEALSIPTSATILCAPYLLYLAGSISLGTVLFNCLAAPVIAPLTILGFISMAFLPIWPPVSGALFTLAEPLAAWIIRIASLHSSVPSISVSPNVALIVIVFISSSFFWRQAVASSLAFSIVFFIALSQTSLPFVGERISDWKIAQCDVGQGDALLVNLGHGEGILFDAGPDPNALHRCLRTFGIRSLPLLVLTHNHADHFQGITGESSIPIGEVWVGRQGDVTPKHFETLHIARKDETFTVGDVELRVLWPTAQDQSYQSLMGDGSLENNRSIVTLVKIGSVSLLVTGDIEPQVQQEITQREDLRGISILKVPHHGSKYQDGSFFQKISPRISLISVGKGNPYGHPNASTIEELLAQGSLVYRTDTEGEIAITWPDVGARHEYVSSPQTLQVRTIGKEWWRIRWL